MSECAHFGSYVFFFFFSSRRRHTRSLRDWSSDVCSSDLLEAMAHGLPCIGSIHDAARDFATADALREKLRAMGVEEIGRASCRERGVDLGGRRIIKKKKEESIEG